MTPELLLGAVTAGLQTLSLFVLVSLERRISRLESRAMGEKEYVRHR